MRTLISKPIFILILITIFGLVLRFYRLSDFPVQLNHDEVSQLYDAISIAQTGKDIYGNFLPTIFPSVNDFKSPFYTYATSVTYFILGDREWIIRIPGVVFGILIIISSYFFVLRLLDNQKIALLSAFLVSTSPSEIFFSRKSFENIAGVFFMITAFYFLLTYLKKNKNIRFLYIAATLMAAGMYTYFSHAIIIPLLLAIFFLIFKNNFSLSRKRFFLLCSFWILLIIPLLLIVFTNPGSRYRSQTVFITQDVDLGKHIGYTNKYKEILDFTFNRYLDQFNPIYIFGNGLDFTNQGLLGMGLLFLIELPFLILGIIYLVKLRGFEKEKKFILAWVLVGMLPSGLTFEAYSPHRSIMVFTMLDIISAIGVYSFLKILESFKGRLSFARKVILSISVLLFFANFIYFIHLYIINFPFEKSQYIQYPFKQVAEFAWSQYQNFDSIVFDPQFGDVEPQIGVGAHYYFAYFGHVPPTKFQKEYKVGSKPREVIFDKFSIRKVYWPTDKDLKNTLVIASPWSVPENDIKEKEKIIKKFYFYNGKLAFYAIKL